MRINPGLKTEFWSYLPEVNDDGVIGVYSVPSYLLEVNDQEVDDDGVIGVYSVPSYLPEVNDQEVDDDGLIGVYSVSSYLPEVDDDGVVGVVVFHLTFQKWMMTGWLGL